MRPLFRSALLALAGTLAVAAPSFAGKTFGLFTCRRLCCKRCMFCVRPYNAFSPVACGSLFLDGCMPFGQGCGPGGGPGMIPYGGMPCGPLGYMGNCGALCASDGGFLPECDDSPACADAAPALADKAGQGAQPGQSTAQQASQAAPAIQAAGYYVPYGYGYVPMMAVPGWNVPAYYPAATPAR
jgi:hypothetical protein